eukprot:4205758-Amphidinium_carterae.1
MRIGPLQGVKSSMTVALPRPASRPTQCHSVFSESLLSLQCLRVSVPLCVSVSQCLCVCVCVRACVCSCSSAFEFVCLGSDFDAHLFKESALAHRSHG